MRALQLLRHSLDPLWLLTVTLGNIFVSVISLVRLPAARSFWLFAIVGAAAAVLFGVRAYFYEPRDYVQE